MFEARLKPIAKGIGSFAFPALRSTHQVAGSASAEHCYNLFMRHFAGVADQMSEGASVPKTLVEVGPGSSLGVGLTALLCGVENYIALDLQDHRSIKNDRRVLAAVARMLEDRAPFSETTDLGAHFFPPSPDRKVWDRIALQVDNALKSGETKELDHEIESGAEERIRFVAPWIDRDTLPAGCADWIMTHSVMEHIDDLPEAYASMAHWLRPGGYATHLIDFSAHTLTKHWNGHWKLSRGIWTLMRGRRPYLINRAWRSRHIDLMTNAGFEVLSEIKFEQAGGCNRDEMQYPYSGMPSGDERVAMSFLVARKI